MPDDGGPNSTGWQETLAETGALTPEITRRILDAHGDRGRRAIEAASEGRVKQYTDFTVVVGHGDEYIIEGGACNCQDARYNLGPDESCWHALAAAIAARVGAVDHHDMFYSDVREFV
ncbi:MULTISPECIES: hypothetical protein [Halobacterium]|uniref:SWIM zinc finger domain protein n=4 Tax=Halobacterium salinarum TaxID=2242 RepID=A0A510N9T5_HALSA|nr:MULTISPECIES: hypothetical protein [Halobacterium]MBB6089251.1 putative nucleic acid-binding Zn finger protein [Halobacterium salinarum]MCF2165855.1 hypothetical protein [Halobacterium salinarum]MCF2167376.1 hypothetical protein [Halobacterium salinarum]MCF2206560.1 hypothetical protein [Halobacterium salinarum]MCF2240297.1 hypothetical protein [Halobacterium salinarum]